MTKRTHRVGGRSFNVEVEYVNDVTDLVTTLVDNAQAQLVQRIHNKMSRVLYSLVMLNFEMEGRDPISGSPFAWPKAQWQITGMRMQKDGTYAPAGPGAKLLILTGELLLSIVRGADADAAWVSTEGVEYARYHQEGTLHMPARPFLMVPESDIRYIRDVANYEVAKMVKEYFGTGGALNPFAVHPLGMDPEIPPNFLHF